MIKYIFYFVLLSVVLTACPIMDPLKDEPKTDAVIIFKNNSPDSVLVITDGSYPDTSLTLKTPFYSTERKDSCLIYPFSSKQFAGQFKWLFNYKPKDFKLMILIFNKTVVEKKSWDDIRMNYLILKRYDLNLQELEDMNWTIIYP